MCLTYDWNAKSQDRMETVGFREYLTGKVFLRDTRETFCFSKLSFLIRSILTHTIYNPITHICWGVLLRENPSHKHWELEIVIPTILYTITCGFSSTPTSPFPYHWEVDSPNTYHTLSECQVSFGAVGKHWKKPSFGGCNRAYCGTWKARQYTVLRSLVEVGAWRAQVHWVD